MSEENRNGFKQDGPKVEWKEMSRHVDQESGAVVIIKQSDHQKPSVGFDVGSIHKKRGHFTTHNLIRFGAEKVTDVRKFAEGLLRLCDDADVSAETVVQAVKKLAPQQHQHHRKPGEPGKTGKTARKKAKQQVSRQPNGTPPATS
jgi:predicted Rossmann fold nucleotide-binding protein DprA/Smf involved in DNA uptake